MGMKMKEHSYRKDIEYGDIIKTGEARHGRIEKAAYAVF